MLALRTAGGVSSRWFDRLLEGCAYLSGALVGLMAAGIGYEVFMRRVLNNPTSWVTDFSEYALLFITFLSAPWLLREGGHVSMTVVTERLSQTKALLLRPVVMLMGAVISAVIFHRTGVATWDLYQEGTILFRTIKFPEFWIWWVMPFGMLLMTIQFLRMLSGSIRDLAAHLAHAKAPG